MSYLYNQNDLINVYQENKEKHIIGKNFKIKKVISDTRIIKNGELFFAIKGDKYDGHDFIIDAISKGCKCIIAEFITNEIKQMKEVVNGKVSIFIVKDTIEALGELAIYNRKRLKKTKVIGITGNIGKTSTKEMIKFVMKGFFKTIATPKNLNNHIGLPMVLANTPIDTEILVLEMGMNHIGEIEYLANIAHPDIAIITTIAPVHIGNFKDINDIVQAKAEIFKKMNKNGIVILNKENYFFNELKTYAIEEKLSNIITIGTEKGDYFIKKYHFNDNFTTSYNVVFREKNKKYVFNKSGISYHNAFNSLFAIAVADIFNLNIKKVCKIIKKIPIPEGRGNLEKIKFNNKKIFLINDAYNASPDALKASIKTLATLKKQKPNKRVVAIIGDMLELGDNSVKFHKEIAKELNDNNIKDVILIGKETINIYNDLQDTLHIKKHFNSVEEFLLEMNNLIKNEDIVLIKASHGMNFYKIINKLKNR